MTITKYGHCCLLIQHSNVTILTDPGSYSTIPKEMPSVDAVLITHDHGDHIHIESLKQVLAASPNAKVYTNPSVGKLLTEAGIAFETLTHGNTVDVNGIPIEAYGDKHAYLHPDIPQTENTGFFIANQLFYPGDAFTEPGKDVEVLALPVAGPWLTLTDAIEYAKRIKPKRCFPVHDGILKKIGSTNAIPPVVLAPLGIEFQSLGEGETLNI